ncbi:MAG: ADP-ribosylglycohydrolase family protein [Peptococcaceae bacterium]|nr:ADP-ribosylglycohydrolase family protein [Peptococcaceae bacterium]
MKHNKDHYRGCLLGGAIGDALGWPVEFMSIDSIRRVYGPAGITDLVLNRQGRAEITDDTQMTLFTGEGLLRAQTRWEQRGICSPPGVVY